MATLSFSSRTPWRLPCYLDRLFISPVPSDQRPRLLPSPIRFPAYASSSPRPTLDDVERISKGKASKAKIGSRAVPHRLNAEERKAYELAKKRGYLVQQVWSRRYSLSNTFQNYCDAIGWPCLRIDQGPAGSLDSVIVNLTTLRLEETDLTALQTRIREIIGSKIISEQKSDLTSEQIVHDIKTGSSASLKVQSNRSNSSRLTEAARSLVREEISYGLIQFLATRSEAKHLCEAFLDCCKLFVH